jgi:hypothetical protein
MIRFGTRFMRSRGEVQCRALPVQHVAQACSKTTHESQTIKNGAEAALLSSAPLP